MENSPDLLSIGQHCSVSECRHRDFLPFTCDCCHKVYCLEHRTYTGHDCPKADNKASTTVVCPLCARAIRIAYGQDPNVIFEEHQTQGCDPTNYAKVHAKQKCPVPGCKDRLTTINSYSCKHCHTTVCLRHRFPEDHLCTNKPGRGSAQAGVGAASSLRNLFGFGLPKATAANRNPAGDRPASLAGRPKAPHGPIRAANSQGSREQVSQAELCPMCNERFSNLNQLIAHSQEVHQTGSADICPHCRTSFPNAVALVEHVERHHSSSNPACVLC